MPAFVARWLCRFTLYGLSAAIIIVLLGHINADTVLSPFGSTISAYAAMDPLGPVEVGIYLSGVACLSLWMAMVIAQIRVGVVLSFTLIVGGAGFLIAAVVPTVEVGSPMTPEAFIHRYASVTACGALLVATLCLTRLADRVGWDEIKAALRATSLVSSTSALAVIYSMYWGDRVYIGLYERVLCAALLSTLIIVSAHLLRQPGITDHRMVETA